MVLIHCYIEKPPGIRPSLPAARAARCVGQAPPTRPPAEKKNDEKPRFFSICTAWGPQDSVQLPHKWRNSMVCGRYNELVHGGYNGL